MNLYEAIKKNSDNLDLSTEVIKNVIKSKNLPNGTKVSSITDDTFNSIVKDVQSKMPNSDEKEVRNKVAGTLFSMFEESDESDEKKVKVSLYGDVKEYPTIEDAIKDMKTAMSMCDPNSSEFKRYLDIYYQLKSGKTSCTDGFNEAEKSTVDGRAEFVRKPVNLDDIKTWGIGSDYFKVVATKELSNEEYDDFTSSLISKDYDWIKKLGKKCRCVDGCFYCIEVINKDNSSSPHILVEPEGYSYARYAAIKPTDMKEADYDSIIGKDKDRGLNESDDFYVIPGNLQSIIDSYSTDVNDPMYDNGYKVPDELLELSLRPPENMRIRDWMRIEAPMEYQLNKIPENLTFKAIHEDPSLFKDLAYEIDSDPRDVIYNQLKDMYGEDFVSNIYEAEVKKVPKRIREYRIIDTGDNDKVLKVFSSKDSSKGYDEMRKMGEELKKQGKEDNLLYKWFYVNNPEYKEAEEVQDDTEKYWDATTLKQDAFLRVMKFNFVEPHGCQYIITNDANELERFRADSDEDAIDYYNEFKSGIDSGLIEIMPADLNIKSIVPREDFNETELSDRKFCDLPDDFQKKVINYLLKKKRGTTDEIIKYLMHAKIGDFNDTSLLTQDEFVDLYEV